MSSDFRKQFVKTLMESYEINSYYDNIRLALKELVGVFQTDVFVENHDITNKINYLLPKLEELSEIKDNNTLFIETENLFNYTNEDALVYLGIVLTSFLKNDPDKTYVDIYSNSKDFTYETGVYEDSDLFDMVKQKFQFFFRLKRPDSGYSKNIEEFWLNNTIIYNTAKIMFIPNNNNDISVHINKYADIFVFRGLKENVKVSNFIGMLLADNQNLIEAINRHIIKQTGNDTLII